MTATFNRADWLLARTDAVDPARNATLGWNHNGNLVSKETAAGTRTFRWDARNTLTAALDGGAEVGRYDYAANGLRVKRRTSSEDVEYVLDDKYVLQEARGAAGHPAYRRYHYADGPLAVDDAAGRRFISTDALGSPTDLTGAAGTVASAQKYDAWGWYRGGTAPTATEPKLGFTGHQFDPESGLVTGRPTVYVDDSGHLIPALIVAGAMLIGANRDFWHQQN